MWDIKGSSFLAVNLSSDIILLSFLWRTVSIYLRLGIIDFWTNFYIVYLISRNCKIVYNLIAFVFHVKDSEEEEEEEEEADKNVPPPVTSSPPHTTPSEPTSTPPQAADPTPTSQSEIEGACALNDEKGEKMLSLPVCCIW